MSSSARSSTASVYVALARKEWRESLPALVAGGAIYVALPLLLSSIYRIFDPHHEPLPGVAMTLWILTGWLFAAVLGAQIVCRDFGRAQGVFLLAQPVRPAAVVWVKGLVGLKLILLLAITSLLFESAVSNDLMPTMILTPMFGAAIAASVVTYGIAFLIATVIRRALPAVMLGVLSLVLIAVLPLLSSRTFGAVPYTEYIAFADPLTSSTIVTAIGMPDALALLAALGVAALITPIAAERFRLPRIILATVAWSLLVFHALHMILIASGVYAMGWVPAIAGTLSLTEHAATLLAPILVALTFGALVAGAAMLAARSDRGVAMHGKALAWVVTLLMLALSLVSINEVGADVPVRATYWHADNAIRAKLAISPDGSRAYRLSDRGPGESQLPSPGNVLHAEVFDNDAHGIHKTDTLALPWWGWSPQEQEWGLSFNGRRRLNKTHDSGADAPESPYPSFVRRIHLLPLVDKEGLLRFATFETGPYSPDGRSRRTTLEIHTPRQTPWTDEPLPIPSFPTLHGDPMLLQAAFESDKLIAVFQHATSPDELSTTVAVYEAGDGEWTIERTLRLDRRNGWRWIDTSALGIPAPGWAPDSFGNTGGLERGADDRLYLTTGLQWYGSQSGSYLACRLADPLLAESGLPGFPHFSAAVALVPGQVVLDETHAAAADQWGLTITAVRDPPPSATSQPAERFVAVGVCPASPLAWLFRSTNPRLLAAGADLLLEVHEDSVVAYDIRDYTRPRRIAHVRSPRIYDAQVAGDWLTLDHRDGFSVVALPDIRRKMADRPRGIQ